MFCEKCGNEISKNVKFCPKCGAPNILLSSIKKIEKKYVYLISTKNKTVVLILCMFGFMGIGGLHRLYVGKIGSGILYLVTCGGFLIGTIIDLVKIIMEQFTDSVGYPVRAQNKSNQTQDEDKRKTASGQVSNKSKLIIGGILVVLLVSSFISELAINNRKPLPEKNKPVSGQSIAVEKKHVDESLDKINIQIQIDDGVFKAGKQKFIVTVKNTSDYLFTGNVTIKGDGINVIDIPLIDVKLQPGESKTTFSFGKVDHYTNFNSSVKGYFDEVKLQRDSALNYEVVKKNVGEGYSTFFVYTEATDDNTIIAMSKEFKVNYEDKFSKGFQVRFTHKKENPTNADSFATYARTHAGKLNVSRVTMSDKGDRVIADNL